MEWRETYDIESLIAGAEGAKVGPSWTETLIQLEACAGLENIPFSVSSGWID